MSQKAKKLGYSVDERVLDNGQTFAGIVQVPPNYTSGNLFKDLTRALGGQQNVEVRHRTGTGRIETLTDPPMFRQSRSMKTSLLL